MDWSEYSTRYGNSVLQIIATEASFNLTRPYYPPGEDELRGSGFIIDIMRGYVVTNSHVVHNARSIIGRIPKLGKYNIRLTLMGVCRKMDLGLCRIHPNDVQLIIQSLSNPETLNLPFDDSLKVRVGEQVLAIGYPLGEENIKVASGLISGFPHLEFDDFESRPTYFQTTASINVGNSGGPLINTSGKVIGITSAGEVGSNNVGYVIPSRLFLAIFDALKEETNRYPNIIEIPNISIDYNNSSPALMVYKGMQANEQGVIDEGIYVRKTGADNIFGPIEEGDIISHLSFDDPFFASSECFDITRRQNSLLQCGLKTVTGRIDNFGDIVFIYEGDIASDPTDSNQPTASQILLLNRRMSFYDFCNLIPLGTTTHIKLFRGDRWYRLDIIYKPKDVYRLSYKYFQFQVPEYEIFAGLVVCPLTLNHIQFFKTLDLYKYMKSKRKYQPYLIVVQILPGSTAYAINSIQVTNILSFVNESPVNTLADLRKALEQLDDIVTIETQDRSIFAIDKATMIQEDQALINDLKLNNYQYLIQ